MKLRMFVLLAACLAPFVSHGQEGDGPCRADADRFCGQSRGAAKGSMDCLLDHQQEISDACYDSLKQRLSGSTGNQPDGRPGARACKQDAETLCKGIQPGGGRIVGCLMDHQKDLSNACYDQLAKRARRGRT